MSERKKCWDCLSFYNGPTNWVTDKSGYILIAVCNKCRKKYNREKNA